MTTPAAVEALPALEDDYALDEEAILAYRRDGHVLLRGLASREEVEAFRPHIRRVVETVTRRHDPQGRIDDYARLFTQVTNVWQQSAAGRRLVFSRRFAKVAARLMGVAGVRLYHDQALFKQPSSPATPWHQDAFYWPLDTERALTLWMPLVDVPVERGPMMFASGSHKLSGLRTGPISTELGEQLARWISEASLPIWSEPLSTGDATFHASRTLHASRPNDTGEVREAMTVIYFADGTRVLDPDNDHRRADLRAFIPGGAPGAFAASPLNPRLYRE